MTSKSLHIDIFSFSFKRGIPYDSSGHGGGYVFDCRGLDNPGRLEIFKKQTGNERAVIEFLEKQPTVDIFFSAIKTLITLHIDNYLERGFNHLSINFGCTGGQHRSVFMANKTYKYISETYPYVKLICRHLELEKVNLLKE